MKLVTLSKISIIKDKIMATIIRQTYIDNLSSG